jgi:hypothetical protein
LDSLVEANPQNGNTKVLKACQTRVRHLRHPHIAAVLDGDKLPDLLRLQGKWCKREARRAFGACMTDGRIELFVLDRNIETLIHEIGRIAPSLLWVTEALHKDRDARDSVFLQAARASHARLRADLCSSVPSFNRLVAGIAGWLKTRDGKP